VFFYVICPSFTLPDIKKLYDRFSRDIKESSYGQSIYYVMESERKIRIGLDL